MKFFLDTANLEELKKGAGWGIVDGVTTNPDMLFNHPLTDKSLEQFLEDWAKVFQESPVSV